MTTEDLKEQREKYKKRRGITEQEMQEQEQQEKYKARIANASETELHEMRDKAMRNLMYASEQAGDHKGYIRAIKDRIKADQEMIATQEHWLEFERNAAISCERRIYQIDEKLKS